MWGNQVRNVKKIIAGAVVAAATATGVSTMAAAPAQAQIESGQYWYGLWKLPTYEFVSSETVTIANGWIRGRSSNLPIHPTRNGGYIDDLGMRTTFWRAGDGYTGRRDSLFAAPMQARLTRLPRPK